MNYLPLTEEHVEIVETICDDKSFLRETVNIAASTKYRLDNPYAASEVGSVNDEIDGLHAALSGLSAEARKVVSIRYQIEHEIALGSVTDFPLEGPIEWMLSATEDAVGTPHSVRRELAIDAATTLVLYRRKINYDPEGDYLAYLTLLCQASGLKEDPKPAYLKSLAKDGKGSLAVDPA